MNIHSYILNLILIFTLNGLTDWYIFDNTSSFVIYVPVNDFLFPPCYYSFRVMRLGKTLKRHIDDESINICFKKEKHGVYSQLNNRNKKS